MMNFGGEGTPEQSKIFEYNSVFGHTSTQQEIFDECSGLVLSALDGYSACVFAYGQSNKRRNRLSSKLRERPR